MFPLGDAAICELPFVDLHYLDSSSVVVASHVDDGQTRRTRLWMDKWPYT